MNFPAIIGPSRVFPDCFIAPFNGGTEQQPHPKYAVQLFWFGGGSADKPSVWTFCLSTN